MDQVREKLWRVALLSLIGLASLNLWTGGPLFALWVGVANAQGSGPLTMTALLVVVIVLLTVSLTLVRLIAVMQGAYNKSERKGAQPAGAHAVAAQHARRAPGVPGRGFARDRTRARPRTW